MLILIQKGVNRKRSNDEKEEKRKKKNIFQNMIPNILFNRSIAIPQGAPINKQETNSPYNDMNSLMQPIQQQGPNKNAPNTNTSNTNTTKTNPTN